MRRTWSYALGLVSLVLLLGGAASAIAQDVATPITENQSVISFTERNTSEVVVDHGDDGPSVGDRYIYRNPLVDDAGEEIGYSSGSCDVVAVEAGADQHYVCYFVISLADGDIITMGEESLYDASATLAVIGGTGIYTGATGVSTYEVVAVTDQEWTEEYPTTITITLPA